MTITIGGTFVAGEKPNPLTYQFQDSTGAPLNLTGYSAVFVYREQDGTATQVAASVSDPANGWVTYTWLGGEISTPGTYLAEFWVGNGSQRYASELITWTARGPVATVPAI